MKIRKIFILLVILKGTLMAIEEPKYTVIQTNDTFELREYTPFIVAQTEVTGNFDEMGKKLPLPIDKHSGFCVEMTL
ncbi:MAG: Unknown protein [uncultured Sulfurovum sp.]|uniref:Uncharacterized protein n=1 Tax=uncultured Sulfurovum sp. TaxID=269237 RepID=A0A6S6TSY8_9BACT|nr:MAG: Unknown protein [uncultured Sulfurovum sp.]